MSKRYVCDCGYEANGKPGFDQHTCIGTPCRECGRALRPQSHPPIPGRDTVPLKNNGLCGRCEARHRAGTTPGVRTPYVPAECALDDWAMLRDQGYNWRDAAPRIGMTPGALDKALTRAKRRGDPRGSRVPFAHDMRRPA